MSKEDKLESGVKIEMEGAGVFQQRHQVRPAFDLQPKGRDSGVP